MAGVLTKRGLLRFLEMALRRTYNGGSLPTNLYLAVVTDDDTPSSGTQTMADLTEIAAGNGYTAGGIALTPGAVDFDVLAEDPSNPVAYIQMKDIQWTASGGTIPASGSAARYFVLTDDNATLANREVLAYWDMTADRVIPDGNYLKHEDGEIALGTV